MYIEMYNNVCVLVCISMYVYSVFNQMEFGNENLIYGVKFFLVGTLHFFDYFDVFSSIRENYLL